MAATGTPADPPAISFVVAADRWSTLGPLVRSLATQEQPALVELVAVLEEDASPDERPEGVERLGGVRVETVDRIEPLSDARAAGVLAASAPIVAMGETHCFPEPGWASAVLGAHDCGLDVVGPRIENANPRTARSWAGLILDYGAHVAIDEPRAGGRVAGHNATYRRQLLTRHGARLAERLAFPMGLLADLPPGTRVADQPSVGMDHWNASSLVGFLRERFDGGMTIALGRRIRWSLPRRLLYVTGAPLIPVVNLWRLRGQLSRIRRARAVPARSGPLLLLAAALAASGEACGYLGGRGLSTAWMARAEMRKLELCSSPRDAADRSRYENGGSE